MGAETRRNLLVPTIRGNNSYVPSVQVSGQNAHVKTRREPGMTKFISNKELYVTEKNGMPGFRFNFVYVGACGIGKADPQRVPGSMLRL